MTKILVPTTGCAAAAETAVYMMQVAKAINAELHVLHVVKPGGSKEAGELTLEFFTNAGVEQGVKVTCEFREGAAINQIIDCAEENGVALIVMGASQGQVVEKWIASDLRDNTTIPVLVIPYQVFE